MKTPNSIIDVRAIHALPVRAIHESPIQPPQQESQKNEYPDHHRRSIRLQNYDYSKAGAYFVTICTQNHIHHFGEIIDGKMNLSHCGLIIEEQWSDLINHFPNLELDAFVIMPNHFHGIIVLTKPESSVGAIPVRENHVRAIHESPLLSPKNQRRKMTLPILIGRFKMLSAKLINEINNNSGNKFWQRNYWEHIIRDEQDLSNIREYIRSNPKNWQKDQLNKANNNPVGSIHEPPIHAIHEIPVRENHELPPHKPPQYDSTEHNTIRNEIIETPILANRKTPVRANHKTPVRANHKTPVRLNDKTPVRAIHESPSPVSTPNELPVGAIHELPLQEPRQFLYNGVKYDRK